MLLLFLALLSAARAWDAAEYEGAAADGHDDVDFDDYYDEEDVVTSTSVKQQETHTHPRIRRFGDHAAARTLSEDEIREVKGVLKELMSGRNMNEMTSTEGATSRLLNMVQRATRSPAFTGLTRSSMGPVRSSLGDPTKFYENIIEEIIDNARRQGAEKTTAKTSAATPYQGFETEETERPVSWLPYKAIGREDATRSTEEEISGEIKETDATGVPYKPIGREDATTEGKEKTHYVDGDTPITQEDLRRSTVIETTDMAKVTQMSSPFRKTTTKKQRDEYNYYGWTPEPTTSRTRRTRRKTTPTTTPKEIIDIETLVEIIANLTLDYELINITDLFNKTLLTYKVPKCLAPPETTTLSTSTTTTEEPFMYDLVNATVISKCFVCGLETPGIPRNAYCADAFAGDFLPLVQVDPLAKGQIATFRKYCRFLDVPGVLQNETQPRSVYGRFTGGCSVRWVDLTGVYTQRACRNRRRAVMGQHFVSKRMAKLEMALTKEDNGCIISPMSSLVPLSRGISLYARFHACVCTGNWCNRAVPRRRRALAAPAASALAATVAAVMVLN